MIPLYLRLLVRVAALLVPGPKRVAWRREWEAELWHRAQSGARRSELWHHANGVFRDAAWFLANERKTHPFDLFRKPLRIEAAFLACALLLCICTGTFRPPHPPYADANRLVVFERNIAFAGAINPEINPRLLTVWKKGASFEAVVPYRMLRRTDLGLHVAPDFFTVLGAHAMLGRTFQRQDPDWLTILAFDTWKTRFHSDPQIVGKLIHIGGRDYKVLGVMPPEFWFRTRDIRFFAPFTWKIRAGGIVAKLNPGVLIPVAAAEVKRLARTVETRYISDSIEVRPLVPDVRWLNLWFGLKIALVAVSLALGFVMWRRFGGWRHSMLLGGRVLCAVFGLFLFRQALSSSHSIGQLSNSLFGFWIFLLICSSAACLLVIDHLGRCPVCLLKLRKPVAIGSWASQILDQPATEYLCPAGHGTLYVAETGNAPDYWTVLDESWRELFAHTEN